MRAVVIDHGLQEGSADVAQRAAGAAEELGATAEVVAVTVDAAPGVSVEAAARTARRVAANQFLLAELAEVTPTSDCATLSTDPAPVRERRIIAWLRGHGVSPSGAPLADMERLCTDWHGQGPVYVGGRKHQRAAVARWCLSPPSGRHRTREAPNVRVAGVHCRHERVVAGSAGAR